MITDLRITDLCRVLRISGVASCFRKLSEPAFRRRQKEIRSFLLQALETEVAPSSGKTPITGNPDRQVSYDETV